MSNMICPKCGKFQEKADICDSCGIAVAKFKNQTTEKPVRVNKTTKQSNGINKIPLFIGVIIFVVVMMYLPIDISDSGSSVNFSHLPRLENTRTGYGINKHEFMPLFDANKPFSSLAKEGHYTVVEGYLDSCSICRNLEAKFPAFLNVRKDVFIQRVHFPEGGINLSFTGENQAEIEKQADEFNARIKSYDFCGTPHIEIYDANKQLIVADSCSKRPATEFLRKWISAET